MANSDNDQSKKRIEPLESGDEEAVKLIREQLAQIHEERQSSHATSREPESLIDTFWRHHGHKQDQQGAWHEFYAGLDDSQKQQLWNEYHQVVSAAPGTDRFERESDYKDYDIESAKPAQPKEEVKPKKSSATTVAESKKRLAAKLKSKDKKGFKSHIKPLVASVAVMLFVLLINYNPLVIAQVKQYVSPGDSLQGPTIIDPNESLNVSEEPRIIIPKINVDVPVVYDVKTYDEEVIQQALERGVVHYGNTPVPGQAGNNVIVGHSSNNFFNSGKYKFAFVLLDRLKLGDTFILHYEGTRYVYKVTNKQVVEPTDFSLIQPTATPTTTLITCTPPGTSWRRLIVQAEQISPAPSTAEEPSGSIEPDGGGEAEIVPGNAPSLWSRFSEWLFGEE